MILQPQFFHDVHDLRPVVHIVCDHMGDSAAKGFGNGGLIQHIDKDSVITAFTRNGAGQGGKFTGDDCQALL